MTKGFYDGFVARFDITGKATWVSQIAGAAGMGNYPLPASLAVGAGGSPVVAGYFFGQVDFGGGTLTSAGGWPVSSPTTQDTDMFVLETSP